VDGGGAGVDYFILHTRRHYSYETDRVFFEEMELPEAGYDLCMGSGRHGKRRGKMLAGIEKAKRTPGCKPQMKFEYEFENAHEWIALELG
jgi:UDP-N-acetylglucosamine 2-epimerase